MSCQLYNIWSDLSISDMQLFSSLMMLGSCPLSLRGYLCAFWVSSGYLFCSSTRKIDYRIIDYSMKCSPLFSFIDTSSFDFFVLLFLRLPQIKFFRGEDIICVGKLQKLSVYMLCLKNFCFVTFMFFG